MATSHSPICSGTTVPFATGIFVGHELSLQMARASPPTLPKSAKGNHSARRVRSKVLYRLGTGAKSAEVLAPFQIARRQPRAAPVSAVELRDFWDWTDVWRR